MKSTLQVSGATLHPFPFPQGKVLNLNELLKETQRMLRRLIGEDVELITSLDPELFRIKADPSQMDQVMMNLAVNARDAMPQGGSVLHRD
jgi:two-component system cell cycle sensor histidine kinase/response regulator CckA